GFRNPFALAHDGERLVVAENGVDIDRFLPVDRGVDHLWAGSDDGLAAHAELVFPESFSPVQLVYVPAGAGFMEPGWQGHYVAAGFGSAAVPAGVAVFGGAAAPGVAATVPRYLVQHLGELGEQHFAGVAIGPDGLYVTPMLPVGDLGGGVLRVRYDPTRAHPPAWPLRAVGSVSRPVRYHPPRAHPLTAKTSPRLSQRVRVPVLSELGGTGCHEVAGAGGGIGPVLDQFGFNYRITEHLNSRPYEDRLRAMMADPNDPFAHLNQARAEVLSASGRRRTHAWLYHMLLEPRFDDPTRQMPNLGLTEEQARAARDELFRVLRVNVGAGSALRGAWELFLRNWRE